MPISKLTHDGTLDIATGRDRNTKNWKNRQVSWQELVNKLSVTHRTAESHAEYLASKKSRQDEIKDIGGFVGGYLANGRRKNGSVVHRQLITLDADFATAEFWSDFQLMNDCAACIYSTHKHSPASPRLRLIIPLDREVMADEYIAIVRRIAGNISINDFDPTGFRPTQLMYWPSTAKDGEYVFEYQDGPWLSADGVLKTYHDWKDASEWPMSDREKEMPLREIKKQGDPLEKPGVVGAFCRTYSISEAIETFLADVYEPCDVEDRYTYKEGSTAAGLVVYEDKYAFSHHGTDPISGKLCNAFDLVRLHKYGLKDEDAREGTPGNKLPSYTEMIGFATADKRVKQQIGTEKLAEASEDFKDFADEVIEEALDDKEWTGELEVDRKGNYLSTIDNIYLILKNDPALKDRLVMNEFEGRLLVKKNLPWRKVTKQTRDFTDDDIDCLAHHLEKKKMPFTHLLKALSKIRNENRIHPVREYLNSLKWDGEERLENLLIDYLGAEENDYTKAVTRMTLVAAVARVFEPGVKFDTVLTLVGKEGVGKSTLIAKLAGAWFSDCLGDIHGKEGMESLRGVWIMEIAEMATFRKADQEAIKRFITSTEDVFRPAYGRQLVRYPRQCIFIATTNKNDFLSSGQGNRRFLPVDVDLQKATKNTFTDLTDYEIDQVWAEALTYYKKGEPLHLSEKIRQSAELKRENHTEVDDREGLIETFLDMQLPDNWENLSVYQRRSFINGEDELEPGGSNERTAVCAAEIWCEALGCQQRDMNSHNTKFIHDFMKRRKDWALGKSSKRFKIYGTQRAYIRVRKAVKNL